MKNKYLKAYMDMACRFAETSSAVRLKVGALIVKDDRIISLGVNGMPPGWPTEECEVKYYQDFLQEVNSRKLEDDEFPYEDEGGKFRLITRPECRHAEIAALEKLWNSAETATGATMFISHSPCRFCAIKIKTSGITKVYYREKYRDDSGVQYLQANGIEVFQLREISNVSREEVIAVADKMIKQFSGTLKNLAER